MYAIQNRQKRAWTVPPVHSVVAGAPEQFKPITINPGDTALVAVEHWDKVSEKNRVIEALLTGRHLVVTTTDKVKDVHVEELENPTPPLAPEELTEVDDRVKLETKTEVVEVSLKDDAPKE